MSGTIERITLRDLARADEIQRDIIELHRERYVWAAQFARGARVLDIACGVGYGSAILKEGGAQSVVGVDISPEAVAEANELYAKEHVQFFCCDYRQLGAEGPQAPSPLQRLFNQQFDLIVSLETIEHLPEPDHFFGTVLRGLRQGGVFVGSVPVTPSVDANPYHLNDFSSKGFRRLFAAHDLDVTATLRQTQLFNPWAVRHQMAQGQRQGLRRDLARYYLAHPAKLWLRVVSTLRHGFVNLYDVVAAVKTR
jgi:2-polyprenyl-3-methyl-5-hydroxy-6-metoxy-1,4-benzoquinol methylase